MRLLSGFHRRAAESPFFKRELSIGNRANPVPDHAELK